MPKFYQNKIHIVDQVTRKTFPWSIREPCKSDDFDQQISEDADGDESYRLMPYPIKARNPVRILTPDEVEIRFTHANFTAQQLGIYSQHDWTKSIVKMKLNQLVDDAAEKFEVNFADFAKQAQLQAQFSQLQNECNNIFKNFYYEQKRIHTLPSRLERSNQRQLFKRIPHRNLWIPLVHIKSNSHYLDCV